MSAQTMLGLLVCGAAVLSTSCGGTRASGADAGDDAGGDADGAVGDANVYCDPETLDAMVNDAGLVKCAPGEICGLVFASGGRHCCVPVEGVVSQCH